MARGQGQQPPGAPPPEMFGRAADLGAKVRDPGEFAPVTPNYANDVQPTVETDGTLTLHFRYLGRGQESAPTSVTLPAGLFAELCSLAPQLITEAAKRAFMQGDKLSKVALASGVKDADLERLMAVRTEATPRQSGSVTDLEDRRG